ncbi:MAG: ATP cone domain-containing protein [Candidatus Woykebacteria bacterium]
MTLIVKRKGHKENFDSRKVYASVYAACLNVHMHEGEAELIADKVSKEVGEQLKSKVEISSNQILQSTAETLRKYNSDAAFMYETHRDVS